MDLRLTNKVAMVGGASKGLGFAVAKALAAWLVLPLVSSSLETFSAVEPFRVS